LKKLLAAILAVLCLAGCAAEKTEPPVVEEEVVSEKPETKEETPEAPELPEVEEVPMEQKEDPAEKPEPEQEVLPESVEYTATPVEGLIEDTIGYVLDCPVFSEFPAAETINRYYADLTEYLEKFTKETIYENAIQKQVTANVYGTVDSVELSREELKIVYAYRVEYSDKQTDENTRTDYFNIQTGETWSE